MLIISGTCKNTKKKTKQKKNKTKNSKTLKNFKAKLKYLSKTLCKYPENEPFWKQGILSKFEKVGLFRSCKYRVNRKMGTKIWQL